MDLTIKVGSDSLNIRVAVLIKTKNGYVLESRNGYYFFVGGRIKINETSEEAVQREILEELGINIEKFTFKTVIENFYILNNKEHIHEVCFVYTSDDELDIPKLQTNVVEIPVTDFGNLDIRPKVLKEYIMKNDNRPHIVCIEGN